MKPDSDYHFYSVTNLQHAFDIFNAPAKVLTIRPILSNFKLYFDPKRDNYKKFFIAKIYDKDNFKKCNLMFFDYLRIADATDSCILKLKKEDKEILDKYYP